MAKITKITARQILDSRGYPTVETAVGLEDKSWGIFSSPGGTSKGKYEALELRDNAKQFHGLSILNGLRKIHDQLAPQLIGQDAQNQVGIDELLIHLDNTENKSAIGANIILSLSGAICKAQANSAKKPLYQYIAQLAGANTHEFEIPTPMFNLLNGGKHGGGNLDFQEFLIVPPQASNYWNNLKMAVETYINLKDVLKNHSALTLIGEEGGYAPPLYSNMDALKLLKEAVESAGYTYGLNVFFSLDVAASGLKDGNSYRIKDRPVALSGNDLTDFYVALNEEYHLLSIEDPFHEDDWDQWKNLMGKIGNETLIVADDAVATNLGRLQKAASEKIAGAVIIKPNQVGTITETIKTVKAAREAGLKIIASHRSGETNDDFIADFAVGIGADYAKFGAPARGERVAKYNRLLEIEHDLA